MENDIKSKVKGNNALKSHFLYANVDDSGNHQQGSKNGRRQDVADGRSYITNSYYFDNAIVYAFNVIQEGLTNV